jgi:hypothetical protein
MIANRIWGLPLPEFAVARYTAQYMKKDQEDTPGVWEACIYARWGMRAYSSTSKIFFGTGIPRLGRISAMGAVTWVLWTMVVPCLR